MGPLSEGRKRHLILRALVTTSIILKRQERIRQPLSDLADMATLIDEMCTEFELELYVNNAFWNLGLEPVRRRRRRRPPQSPPKTKRRGRGPRS